MRLTNELDELAKQAKGNWLKFECFAWDRLYELDNPENYFIFYTNNRDSGLIDQANSQAIENILSWFLAHNIILSEHHNHWACGWIDGYAIPVYTKKGHISKAFEKYYNDVYLPLQNYPLLDDMLYSQLEYDTLLDNIDQCLKFDCKFDLRDNLPDDYISEIAHLLYDQFPEDTESPEDSWPEPEHLESICNELGYIQ